MYKIATVKKLLNRSVQLLNLEPAPCSALYAVEKMLQGAEKQCSLRVPLTYSDNTLPRFEIMKTCE